MGGQVEVIVDAGELFDVGEFAEGRSELGSDVQVVLPLRQRTEGDVDDKASERVARDAEQLKDPRGGREVVEGLLGERGQIQILHAWPHVDGRESVGQGSGWR